MARNRTNNVIFGWKKVFSPMGKYERWRKQAKLLKLSAEARRRLEWFIYYSSKGKQNASATCRHFNILPKVFYFWKKRFDGIHLETLEERSRAPKGRRQREITPREEERVVELRNAHLRWGKMKIARIYFNTYGQEISSWKVQYTIQKYRLYYHPKNNAKVQAKRKRGLAKKRITEKATRFRLSNRLRYHCHILARSQKVHSYRHRFHVENRFRPNVYDQKLG